MSNFPNFQSNLSVFVTGRILTELKIQEFEDSKKQVRIEFLVESLLYFEGPEFDQNSPLYIENRAVHLFRAYGDSALKILKRFNKGDSIQITGEPRISKSKNGISTWYFVNRIDPLPEVPSSAFIGSIQKIQGTVILDSDPFIEDLENNQILTLNCLSSRFTKIKDNISEGKLDSNTKWSIQSDKITIRTVGSIIPFITQDFSKGDCVYIEGQLQQDTVMKDGAVVVSNWIFLTSIAPISLPVKRTN